MVNRFSGSERPASTQISFPSSPMWTRPAKSASWRTVRLRNRRRCFSWMTYPRRGKRVSACTGRARLVRFSIRSSIVPLRLPASAGSPLGLRREGDPRSRRTTYRTHTPWALPGGWVRRGENPAEAVVREIREETTLDVEVLAPLTVQMESPVHLTVIYGARLIGGTFRPSAEVAEVRFLEPGIWPEGLREDHR